LKRFSVPLIVTVIVIGIIFTGCATPAPTTPTEPTTPTKPTEPTEPGVKVETIKWGSAHPLTGSMAPYGIGEAYGTRFAVDTINANGGYLVGDTRYMIELIELDTRWDPKTELAAAEKLVDEGVKFTVWCCIGTPACQSITEPNGMILVCPGLPPEITRPGIKYTFPTAWSEVGGGLYPHLMGPESSGRIFTNVNTLAMLTTNSGTEMAIRDIFKEVWTDLGEPYEIVYDEVHDPEVTDFTSYIGAIRAKDPDLFFLNGTTSVNCVYIYPQMKDVGWTPQVLGMDPLLARGAPAKKIAGSAAVGIVEETYYFPYDAEVPDWGPDAVGFDPVKRDWFNTNFEAEYGVDWMASSSVHGYDFVYGIMFNAALAGTVTDTDAIVAALETETPMYGAMAKTFWYADTHRFALPPLLAQYTMIDGATGGYAIRYLGGGLNQDSSCKNWELIVDVSIDCSQDRDV